MQEVDAQYYGFRDDDDGIIVPLELEAEKVDFPFLFTLCKLEIFFFIKRFCYYLNVQKILEFFFKASHCLTLKSSSFRKNYFKTD